MSHMYREGNQCANWLEMYGARSEEDFLVFVTPPTAIQRLPVADAAGACF